MSCHFLLSPILYIPRENDKKQTFPQNKCHQLKFQTGTSPQVGDCATELVFSIKQG